MKRITLYYWMILTIFLITSGSVESQTVTTHEILIRNFTFSPSELHIDINDTVIFRWADGATGHNVEQVSGSSKTDYESGFRSGDPQNGPAEWTLPKSYTQDNGTLYYICGPHVLSHTMRGKIHVGIEDADNNGGNLGIILGIFVGTGLFMFAGIVLLQKRKKSV